MDFSYIVTPFFAWFVAGSLKFLINSFKAKKLAFGLIGYGGLPSNHSAIVSSMVVLIALKEGVAHPAFGVAVTLAFIVVLDANSLRRQVGKHAMYLNKLSANLAGYQPLRERIGHSRIELLAGGGVGSAIAFLMNYMNVFFGSGL